MKPFLNIQAARGASEFAYLPQALESVLRFVFISDHMSHKLPLRVRQGRAVLSGSCSFHINTTDSCSLCSAWHVVITLLFSVNFVIFKDLFASNCKKITDV